MVRRDSESPSSSSASSDADSDGGGHPMDAAVRRRAAAANGVAAAAAAANPKSSSPESGEVPDSPPTQPLPAVAEQPATKGKQVAGKKRRRTSADVSDGGAKAARAARSVTPDLDAELASASDASASCSDSEGGSEQAAAVEPAVPAPAGVILVDTVAERNAEVQRLLRAPR